MSRSIGQETRSADPRSIASFFAKAKVDGAEEVSGVEEQPILSAATLAGRHRAALTVTASTSDFVGAGDSGLPRNSSLQELICFSL